MHMCICICVLCAHTFVNMLSLSVFPQTLLLRPGWTFHITRPLDSFHRELKHSLSFMFFFSLLSLHTPSASHTFPLLEYTMWPPWKTCSKTNKLFNTMCVWLSCLSTHVCVSYGTSRHDLRSDRDPERAREMGALLLPTTEITSVGRGNSGTWVIVTDTSLCSDWVRKWGPSSQVLFLSYSQCRGQNPVPIHVTDRTQYLYVLGKYSVPHLYPNLEKIWMILLSRICDLTQVLGLYFIDVCVFTHVTHLCIHIFIHICICILYVHIHIYVCICIYVYRCVYMYMCAYLCMCVFMHMCTYLYMCIYMCMYICEHILLLLTICKSLTITSEWSEGACGRDRLSFIPSCCSDLSGLCLTASVMSAGSWWANHWPPPPSYVQSGHWTLLLLKGEGSTWDGCSWKGRNIAFTVSPVTRWWSQEKAKWGGLGASKVSLLEMSKALASSSLVTPRLAGSLAAFLSALLREALLIHPHENGSFIHIDIINEEPGSMLYQLTPQGKVKWAFFWRVVPKLRTVTHSK